ncbi:MAG: glutamate--tRNA ligase [Rhodospirillales bacterium]
MTVVTRFAPSPTGYLHIGGARTALYNWLFARHFPDGKFYLRIEDTDRKRSTQDAVDAIFDGLTWLGLDWDGDPISQFERADQHRAAAERLLAEGKAYKCYCSPEELAAMRDAARKEGRQRMYDGTWRDRDPAEAPAGVDPVIRLKAPLEGETVIDDLVQGQVTVANAQLDDMVLLRADGTPTYMLAVVVDDHDMGITHVIRGDDHLTNAFRQTQLYLALGWDRPQFAHIPLIHGPDGAKMSKRHGALGVEAYRDDGFLPEALRNYLLRLGWSHGDDEIISTEQAIEWFGLENVGKSAARFDLVKLTNLNGHYIREADNHRLVDLIMARLDTAYPGKLAKEARDRLFKGMAGLKERAKTISELSENASFYALDRPIQMTEKASQQLGSEGTGLLRELRSVLETADTWSDEALMATAREFAETGGRKLGAVAQPVRAALTGSTVSPSVFEIMDVLGREETLGRIDDALTGP